MLLEVDRITAGYGHAPIIEDISLEVETGEIVCIIGPNGAGKSTVLRTVAGQLTPSAGRVRYAGEDITRLGIAERGRRGLMFIPQGMNIFPNLTVRENLEIAGLLISGKQPRQQAIRETLDHYPIIGRKKDLYARDLSGGERQLLALSRTRILRPRLVVLDEPSLGLAPLLVNLIFDEIVGLTRLGVSILLVEQNARKALSISHRGYVLELGRNRLTGTGSQLLHSEEVQRLYLGGEPADAANAMS
jgi:ABC-type branched-subunit amino acid transport system ATPase component